MYAATGTSGRAGTMQLSLAVVNSCQNHIDKTVANQLSGGFNPCLSQTFFQFLDLFEALFFHFIVL